MKASTKIALVGSLCVIALVASANTLDFEFFSEGEIVNDINGVKVFGFNPNFGADVNAAVIFDSSNPPGIDFDLGTPNEAYGGPGIGAGGASNDTALGNILIVADNLIDDNGDGLVDQPNDADYPGAYLEFDFSQLKKNGNSTVTVNEVTIMDVEKEEGEDGTFIELSGPNLPLNLIAIPPTGDNGVVVISGINLAGVDLMRVNLNGSAAVASVVYNENRESSCWFTFGGFQNAGIQSGGKDFTFGGNVGPPPSGSIEVNDHNTGAKFHTNDVHIVSCETIQQTGPDQPGGKKGFTVNKATFEGVGRLNGVKGYPCEGYVIDAGEPAGKKNKGKDYFEIVVRDPDTNAVVFVASGELDGGNVQLHPGK